MCDCQRGTGNLSLTGTSATEVAASDAESCAPWIVCEVANGWACVGNGVQFNKCNIVYDPSDPFGPGECSLI